MSNSGSLRYPRLTCTLVVHRVQTSLFFLQTVGDVTREFHIPSVLKWRWKDLKKSTPTINLTVFCLVVLFFMLCLHKLSSTYTVTSEVFFYYWLSTSISICVYDLTCFSSCNIFTLFRFLKPDPINPSLYWSFYSHSNCSKWTDLKGSGV